MKNIKKQLKNIPSRTGVYLFFYNKTPIYIGKAINLKSRVNSYFQKSYKLSLRIKQMTELVTKVDYKLMDSEIEALIFEAELIKKYQPKYNIKSKDNKSYLYLAIDMKEDFPGIYFIRQGDLGKKGFRYFGPYTSAENLKQALRFLRKIFPFRSCLRLPKKSCLWYHIGQCQGPCEGKISKTEYHKILGQLIQFFKGKKQRLIKKLGNDMKVLVKKRQFESAAILRDRIFALKHLQNVWLTSGRFGKKIPHRIECYDISNIFGKYATGAMAVFVEGGPDKSQYRKFKIRTVKKISDTQMLAEILKRRFKHSEWLMPNVIIIDGGKGQLNIAQKVILESTNLSIPIVAIAKGPKRKVDRLFYKGKKVLKDKKLIQQVRDEAHRFAIKYHRWLRSKDMLEK